MLYMRHTKFSLVQQFIGGVLTHLDGKANGALHETEWQLPINTESLTTAAEKADVLAYLNSLK